MAVSYLACMALVAQLYQLPPRVLPSLQVVEGGVPAMISHNTNGTDDLGVMQINTTWIPALSRISGLAELVVRDRLINRPCFNIAASGYIMRTYLDETKGDLMQAVGNYHSHTPELHFAYRRRVLKEARRLFHQP